MNDTIRDAIVASHESGDSRDAVIISLVSGHDLSLNAATKAYAAVAKAEGWTTAPVSHKEAALADLRDQYPVEDWDAQAVKDAVIDLADRYGIAESTARDYAKAYSDELEVTHPVLNPREAMFQWFVDVAPTIDDYDDRKAAFKAFAIDDLGRSESNANEYWKGYDLHLALVAAGA